MKLYSFWRSTCSWRVRIALQLKGVAYHYQPVNLAGGEQHGDEYARLNPMRQVPVLELDDGTRIAQSMAILDWLDATHPDPPLQPRALMDRVRARQQAEIITSGIQPLQNTSTQSYVRDQLHADAKEWTRHWVTKGLGALELEMAATAGRFAVGDAVSIADVCLVPEMYFARRFHVDLTAYPTLVRVDSACQELPAFQRAHGEAQPDFAG
jgi:maleylpyruvate isomerase